MTHDKTLRSMCNLCRYCHFFVSLHCYFKQIGYAASACSTDNDCLPNCLLKLSEFYLYFIDFVDRL